MPPGLPCAAVPGSYFKSDRRCFYILKQNFCTQSVICAICISEHQRENFRVLNLGVFQLNYRRVLGPAKSKTKIMWVGILKIKSRIQMLAKAPFAIYTPNIKYVLFVRTEVCLGLEIRHVGIISCFRDRFWFPFAWMLLFNISSGGRQTS